MLSVSHLKWQVDDERRSRANPAGDMYRTAQLLNNAAHDVEAEPQALRLAGGDGPFERLEDARLELGGDTETVVHHLESGVLAMSVAGTAFASPIP